MKLSDYVADFLARQGIRHVFAITGGASIHLIHSIADHPDIDFVCPHHEQAAAMAADGYARASGGLGCAIATSGPGATNLMTGIACAWFDSIPMIFITGQVVLARQRGDLSVRQIGFQETDIVEMVRPITKYAVMVRDPLQIRYELEKAVSIAKSGRRGPVLIDLPDDLQRMDIDESDLAVFDTVPQYAAVTGSFFPMINVLNAGRMISEAARPVLIIGAGARPIKDEINRLAIMLQIPICPTWGALDMFPSDHPLLVGPFGMDGTRYGNFAVQNADLVIAVGARMSTRETGNSLPTWAPKAKTIVVDIDQAELDKFPRLGRPLDFPICGDAKQFIGELLRYEIPTSNIEQWWARIAYWKALYPICKSEFYAEIEVNPYAFVNKLSQACEEGEIIVCDTGSAISWMMQGFQFKKDQRLFHDWNNTAMGWALPAAIGASLALNKKRVICVVGDGSLMMNIQELSTVAHHKLPIKLFVLNNGGYSMVQQTEEQWLDGKHCGTTESGLSFPYFAGVAAASGWPAVHNLDANKFVPDAIKAVLASEGPALCDVRIPSSHRIAPKMRAGFPLEDAEPRLPREEFEAQMRD